MPTINFTAPLTSIGTWTIIHLPKPASAKLPSRGMVMAEGTLNGKPFRAPLEPDGKGSHWFKVMDGMKAGDEAVLEIEPMEEWPNPTVPADVKKMLSTYKYAQEMWDKITPKARWDWIRWIRATNNPDTRAKRIIVAASKMKSGMRNPCCFNRSACTEPAVSKGGVLLEIE